jgi:hypothetical protein
MFFNKINPFQIKKIKKNIFLKKKKKKKKKEKKRNYKLNL